MSDVISFLEMLGSDPRFRSAPEEDIEQAMLDIDLDPSMRTAILAKDVDGIQALLGQGNLIGMLTPSPTPQEEPEPEEEEEGEEPEQLMHARGVSSLHRSLQ